MKKKLRHCHRVYLYCECSRCDGQQPALQPTSTAGSGWWRWLQETAEEDAEKYVSRISAAAAARCTAAQGQCSVDRLYTTEQTLVLMHLYIFLEISLGWTCMQQTNIQLYSTHLLPSVLWGCWLGVRKGIWPGAGVVICLEWGANDLWFAYGPADATATPSSLAPVNPERFTFLVPAYPGCPGKKVVKRM